MMISQMKSFVFGLAVILTLVGCGTSASTEANSGGSGIAVEATLGPTCPGPASTLPSCGPQPYRGRLEVTDQVTGKVVATISTDAEGRARAELAPGSYHIETPNAGIPSANPVSVKVSPGAYSQVKVSVDSGLR